MPTLKSYSLLMAAITLMHRGSQDDFEEAYQLLQAVIDRGRRQALPQAWLAQWYVLRMQQGWSPVPKEDAWQAQDCAQRALDADPECSLALTVDGLVQTHFRKRLDLAQARYSLAVQRNPSDSLAWLLKGAMHAFQAEGRIAVDNTQRARMLSPLDPQSYYYDSLAGRHVWRRRIGQARCDWPIAHCRRTAYTPPPCALPPSPRGSWGGTKRREKSLASCCGWSPS